ncbi:MAG: hypothetical protein WAR77_03845 [Saprospiraceae bacterium]
MNIQLRFILVLISGLFLNVHFGYSQADLPTVHSITPNQIYFKNGDSLLLKSGKSADYQLIILLYHAEQDTIGLDPGLSVDGRWRAINLKKLFNEIPFEGYFTTPFRNNILTLQPIVDSKKMRPYLYDQADIQALTKGIDNLFPKPVMVIVHPETVGLIFEHLTGVKWSLKMGNKLSENLVFLERSKLKPSIWNQCKYRIR